MKYQNQNCPLALGLSVLGNHWTLLIARNILKGVNRFDRIQKDLKISRNLLSKRLKEMEADGLLKKVTINGNKRKEYLPTQKCQDLIKIFFSFSSWSEKWIELNNVPKLRAKHKINGKSLSLKFVFDDNNDKNISIKDVQMNLFSN